MKLTRIPLEGNKCKFCQRKEQDELYRLESNYRLNTIICNHCMLEMFNQFNKGRLINPDTGEKELKLVAWARHHYPPIDLNANVSHVAKLIQEVIALRQQVKGKKKYSVPKGKKKK